MVRYIDVDRTLAVIDEVWNRKYAKCGFKPLLDCYRMIIRRIKQAPKADVAPRAEVAMEIFEEIENNYADFLFDGHRNIVVLTEKDFAELKKKYTEGV